MLAQKYTNDYKEKKLRKGETSHDEPQNEYLEYIMRKEFPLG